MHKRYEPWRLRELQQLPDWYVPAWRSKRWRKWVGRLLSMQKRNLCWKYLWLERIWENSRLACSSKMLNGHANFINTVMYSAPTQMESSFRHPSPRYWHTRGPSYLYWRWDANLRLTWWFYGDRIRDIQASQRWGLPSLYWFLRSPVSRGRFKIQNCRFQLKEIRNKNFWAKRRHSPNPVCSRVSYRAKADHIILGYSDIAWGSYRIASRGWYQAHHFQGNNYRWSIRVLTVPCWYSCRCKSLPV